MSSWSTGFVVARKSEIEKQFSQQLLNIHLDVIVWQICEHSYHNYVDLSASETSSSGDYIADCICICRLFHQFTVTGKQRQTAAVKTNYGEVAIKQFRLSGFVFFYFFFLFSVFFLHFFFLFLLNRYRKRRKEWRRRIRKRGR